MPKDKNKAHHFTWIAPRQERLRPHKTSINKETRKLIRDAHSIRQLRR